MNIENTKFSVGIAHVMGTAVKATMQAALRESWSAAYDYLFVLVKKGGLECVTIQQKQLAAMSQDLLTSLKQPGLKGDVYKDRYRWQRVGWCDYDVHGAGRPC